ncbi:MAG TPA: EAL domain-containing protein, partial [Dissulfurispiraceae bacterium]
MKDEDKTREQLLEELRAMRQLLSELGVADSEKRMLIEERLDLFALIGRERRRAEESMSAVLKAHHILRTLIDRIPVGVVVSDAAGSIVLANPAAHEMFGGRIAGTADMPEGMFTLRLSDGSPLPRGEFPLALALSRGEESVGIRMIVRHKGGSERTLIVSGSPLFDLEGRIEGAIAVLEDITERTQMEEAVRRQAFYDILTGLPNRTLFIDHLGLVLSNAHRSNTRLSVVMLDIDRFKIINDTLGHPVGDQLLKEVAHRLKACLREGDTVARTGGDEYSILLPQISRDEDVIKIAKKVLSAFTQPFEIERHTLHIAVSVGVGMYPDDGEDVDTLLQNADTAMYNAKEQGGSTYQFYNPAMNLHAYRRIMLESSLRQSLESGGLVVFYQPQVDIASGEITGIEALVRWRHPEMGVLLPDHFISIAEETGLIVPIDEWVLRTACMQNKAWQDAGFRPIVVTVNLSERRFMQPDLVETISRILEDTSLDSRFLDLEITEKTVMRDMEANVAKMARLGDMGIQLSLDGFGTEYISLRRLRRLPIQKLKIDRTFISGILTESDYRTILDSVIDTAHSLRLRVVAEGVETEAQ